MTIRTTPFKIDLSGLILAPDEILGEGEHGNFARTFYSERISEIIAKVSQKYSWFGHGLQSGLTS